MKKINFIILLLAIFSTGLISQNAIDNLFESYLDNDDFTVVSISGKMLSMISNSESDKETDDILSSLKGLNILTTEKNAADFYKTAKSKLFDNNYEELMKVRDKNANVLFLVKDSNGNTAKELILLVGEKDNTVIMSFIGNIDLDKISKLGKAINIKGADKLDNLEDR